MESAVTETPLFSNDENSHAHKDHSKLKLGLIIGACVVLSIGIGILIGYFVFGKNKQPKIVREVIYGDYSSEITDPKDTYALIDARNESEWKEVRIESAILIPVYEIDVKIGNYVQNKSFPIKVFCKGGIRGAKAKEKLLLKGYNNVVNLGGIDRAAELIKDAVVIHG